MDILFFQIIVMKGRDIKEFQYSYGVVKEVESRFQDQEILTWSKMYTKNPPEASCTIY